MSFGWLQAVAPLAVVILMCTYGWWWGTRDERARASRWRVVVYDRVTSVLEDRRFFDLDLTPVQRKVIAEVIDEAATKFEDQGPKLSQIGGDVTSRTQPLASRYGLADVEWRR